MKKFEELIEKYLVPVAGWVSNNKVISAISAGFVAIMPFTLIAAVFSIVASLPSYLTFLHYSDELSAALLLPYNFIYGVLALLAVFMIAYNYAKSYKLNPTSCGLVALIIFFIISSTYSSSFMGPTTIDGSYFGYSGIFTAVLVAILSVQVYRLVTKANLLIKLPDSVPPLVRDSFEAIIPYTVDIAVFYVISIIFQKATGMMIPEFIQSIVTPVINASDGLGYIWITGILGNLFWWFGMHGWMIVSAPLLAVTSAKLAEQAAAYAAGQELPYIIVGGWSYSPYAWLFPLMLIVICKAKRNKAVGKMSIIPSLFCITEPYYFGVPIVMNPVLLIPFLLENPITLTLNYLIVKAGLLNRSFTAELSTLPTPINTFLTTGDWRAFIWFIPITLVKAAVWYPFLKVWDNKCLEEEKQAEALKAE